MTSLLNIAGNIPVSAAAGGQSLRFEDGDSPYLENTPTVEGDRRTFTISVWAKRGLVGSAQNIFQTRADSNSSQQFSLQFKNNDKIRIIDQKSGVNELIYDTNAVFRDVSAWYHIVVAVDTTESVNTDRCKLYVNGEQVTSFSTQSPKYDSNYQTSVNNDAKRILIGAQRPSSSSTLDSYFDGYLANFCLIDGTALDPTSFGEYEDTLWKPKSDTDIQALTFGTNGFYLPFKQTTEAEGFSTVTYTGNASVQGIEGVGFEPDFVWIKERSDVAPHALFDSVRGVGKSLQSDNTGSEITATDSLTSFDSNGFTLGDNTEAGADINYTSGSNYVAWCWDAGSGSTVSNTDGSITSTVKANTAKGFSIVSYTGTGANATIGHGLSSAPEMIIFKETNASDNWSVYHTSIGNTYKLRLNGTNAQIGPSANLFNSTSPTSTVFSTGTDGELNGQMIAYCFHSVSGYSKISSYSGTGAAGNSITGLGFKPAWLMYKRSDSTGNWIIHDNTRDVDGDQNKRLYPNLNNAEQTVSPQDVTFDSDGFTMNTTGGDGNASGGTYIYMAFKDTRDATFFGDTSGNSNNWTPNKLNNTDVVLDSPVSGGNFATHLSSDSTAVTISEGNLAIYYSPTSWRSVRSTFEVSSGKWYWEVRAGGSTHNAIGVAKNWLTTTSSVQYVGITADSYGYLVGGQLYNNGSGSSYGATYTTGDIIGVALDMDSGTLEFFKNNVSQGTAATGLSGSFTPVNSVRSANSLIANFGQDSSFAGNATPQGNTDDNGVGDFYYAPPSGFLALTTGNLPTPTITAPDEYFNTVLYTGNGSTQSITGVGFQPSWLWLKNRSTSNSHALYDSVRGSGTNGLYGLSSNTTNAELDGTNVTSLDSDGFTLGSNSGTNGNGNALVAWNWLAGGTAVSNTDGSITSQVSANTDAGFSVVSWSHPNTNPETIGHGLSSAPEFIIIKSRDSSIGWFVGTDYLSSGWNQYLILNGSAAQDTASGVYNNTAPSSSVFTLGSYFSTNTANDDMIAYCFHSVDGYSLCSSYTGNGSSDGVFVHCGFRPAWVMLKNADTNSRQWFIMDNKRNTYNVVDSELRANQSNAESTSVDLLDFTSNGFKIRHNSSSTSINDSGNKHIFLAFAEAPFSKSNAR